MPEDGSLCLFLKGEKGKLVGLIDLFVAELVVSNKFKCTLQNMSTSC